MGEGTYDGLVGPSKPAGLPGGGVPARVSDEQTDVRSDMRGAGRDGDEEKHDAPRRDPSSQTRRRLRLAFGNRSSASPRVRTLRVRYLHVSQARHRGLPRDLRRHDAQVSPLTIVGFGDPIDEKKIRIESQNTKRRRIDLHHSYPHHRSESPRGGLFQQEAHGEKPEDVVLDHGPGSGQRRGDLHRRLHREPGVPHRRSDPR